MSLKIGDKVRITAEGTIEKISNSHGWCALVVFDQKDFTTIGNNSRSVWVDENELEPAETDLTKWLKKGGND